jgi:hypothetical protein
LRSSSKYSENDVGPVKQMLSVLKLFWVAGWLVVNSDNNSVQFQFQMPLREKKIRNYDLNVLIRGIITTTTSTKNLI